MDIYLTVNEVANFLGITVQGLHKLCREQKFRTKYGTKHKIYPKVFRDILSLKGMKLDSKKLLLTIHAIKGGLGKTTIAHCLGVRASCYGFKTLIIDLDKQANLSESFQIFEDQGNMTIFDVFKNIIRDKNSNFSVKEAIVKVSDYLHIIPSDIEVANFDLEVLVSRLPVHDLFEELLEEVIDEYDVILFDLPADFNSITLAAHIFTKKCLIPMELTAFSEKGVKLTEDHIARAQKIGNSKIDFILQGNFFDQRKADAIDEIGELKHKYGDRFSSVIIPISQPIKTNLGTGKFLWSLPKSKAPALVAFENILLNLLNFEKKHMKPQPKTLEPHIISAANSHSKGVTQNA